MRLSFFFSEAFGSLRRNWVMTMASVITVFISMAIMGLVLVTEHNLNQGATSLKNRVEIEVFITNTATPAEVTALETTIRAMPEVKSVEFISKDQALEEFRKRLGENADQILNNLPSNPLPASYKIQVKDANQVDTVAARFFDDPNVDNDPGTHNGVKYAQETVRSMLSTISLAEKAMWAITIIFSVAAVLLISTTVRLSIFSRRREIEIMRLVGATNWFIRWPFVLEGFFTGLLGSILAGIGVYLANYTVVNWIQKAGVNFLDVDMYPVWVQRATWPLGLMPTLVLIGTVLGSFGSAVALRRHLRT